MHMLVLADGQQQLELLLEEGVVVLQPESEERKRLDGRPTANDHLCAARRQQGHNVFIELRRCNVRSSEDGRLGI